MPHPARRLALLVIAAAVVLVGPSAALASAHSTLVSTSPAAGERLERAPAQVLLRFDEGVGVNAGSLRVLDVQGRRVDVGDPQQPITDRTTVSVALPAGLPTGSYSVVWQVVSLDGHPARGAFAFGVGVPAGSAAVQPVPDRLTGALHAVVWFAGYVGAVLVIGPVALVALVWPAGRSASSPRRLVRFGWWTSVGSAVVLFLLQGPFGAGLGPSYVADLGLLQQTMTGRVGLLLLLRLFALGLAAASGPWLGPAATSPIARDAVGVGVLLLPTFSLAGHSGEGALAPLAVVVDALHLAAAAVWLGGLAALALGVPESADVLRRWSRLAMTAVGVLAVSGTFQAWRAVASPSELAGPGYGRLLLVKLAGVAVLVVLGDQGRRRVQRLARARDGDGTRALQGLRGVLLAEVAIGLLVLGATTQLVATATPRSTSERPTSLRVVGPSLTGFPFSAE